VPRVNEERLGAIVPLGLACAVWSFLYDPLGLPPRLPGTVGLTLAGDVLPQFVVPALFARLVLRRPLAVFGLRAPGLRRGAGAAALAVLALLPLVLVLARRPEFQAFYPSPAFPPARAHVVGLVALWLLHHVPQLFATEFLMRGFLLLPLARGLGLGAALAVTGVPYVLLHATKPPLELLLAAAGAVAFGLAAWRTRSVWPAFAAHLATAAAMDALCLLHAGGFAG
jgi:membrane protease YdiL (CAAX protease family)